MIDYFFIFTLGSIFGSFFNVLLLRKNTGESVIFKPSRCFSCGARLEVRDLIPVFSFLFLKGRCRHCGSRISRQYPIAEFLIGVLAVAIYAKFSIFNSQFSINFKFPISFLWYFSAFASLFLVAAYDFRTKIIDSHFLRIFGAFAIIEFLRRGSGAGGWFEDLISSFLIALFFYLIWRLSGGRWMGRGDADFAALTSLFLGWPLNLAALFFAFWIGGIFGAFLLIFGKAFTLKSEIPFGPFLALAVFAAWLFPLEQFLNMLIF